MSLLYPLGLLLLIAIPILILIYIIKNKYTEKTVSSTYLWKLSEQFIKKRRPISRIVGIVSLLLQIACVIFLAVSVTNPVFVIPRAAKEYCFILDGSGSMNIVEDGQTRFDKAKNKIGEMIDGAFKGSVYSLVFVGGTTDTIFENYTDKDRCKKLLSDLDVSYCETGSADMLSKAQELFDANRSVDIYLMTDKSYEQTENVTVVNVGSGKENYAVSDLSYEIADGSLNVGGNVISYENAATLHLELYLDGGESPALTQEVSVEAAVQTPFTFICKDKIQLKSARVVITDGDGLTLDNEAVIYNVDYENSMRTLIVSDYPFYIQAGLISAGNSQIDVVKTKDYNYNGGYDLYVFDSYTPEELPTDGAVWFFNPRSSISGTNFNFQGDTYPSSSAEFSKSTSKTIRSLLNGLTKKDFELSKYVRIGLSGRFTTLATLDGSPLIFAGTNIYGNREVVFAFDLHDSASFTLSLDYTLLTSNLLNYSFPAIIGSTSYYAGDTLEINIVPGADSLYIKAPSGKEYYPDTSIAICEFDLNEVGSYTVIMTMKDKSVRTFNVSSSLPLNERVPNPTDSLLIVRGIAENNMRNGIYDSIIAFLIIFAVIAVADFGVYTYEQYQLR